MSDIKLTQEFINQTFEQSEKTITTVFNKTTIMAVKLPNGFVLVEASSCVDPANYSLTLGQKICEERIKNKIWELEGYLLQDRNASILK